MDFTESDACLVREGRRAMAKTCATSRATLEHLIAFVRKETSCLLWRHFAGICTEARSSCTTCLSYTCAPCRT
jgi:hypothetical protein